VTKPLNIIFAGTPVFAAVALEALLKTSHHIVAVYTQPDKPAGRGLKLTPSPVKTLALSQGLAVHQPTTLKTAEEQDALKAFNADVMVVAAYGMILPKAVLDIPQLGCINIHPSLLPRWRGAAPIQRTIDAGDKETGVTIMQMDEGLDTGPILLQNRFVLSHNETSASLHDELAKQGANLLIETLAQLANGSLTPLKQDDAQSTYAKKITKEEAEINWQEPAWDIECKVRAFNPWPMMKTTWQGDMLRIGFAKALTEKTTQSAGTLIRANENGIDIATGSGVLRLLQLQKPGGKMLSVADFYHAHADALREGCLFQ
jgi:methionyl-tRNA formyltransferase